MLSKSPKCENAEFTCDEKNVHLFGEDDLELQSLSVVENSQQLRSFPGEIFTKFPLLETLSVEKARIQVLLGTSFENGHHLKYLDLKENNIRVIPSYVFVNLTELVEFHLSHNEIETIEDHAFDGLLNLNILDVSVNRIRALTPFALIGAKNLRTLSLAKNELAIIEEGALNLPELTILDAEHNHLHAIPEQLCLQSPNLEAVYLYNNSITHIGKIFEHCDQLEILYMSSNSIQDLDLNSIANMKSLKDLAISNNSLTSLNQVSDAEASASSSASLVEIGLDMNSVSNSGILKRLKMFPKLKVIFLSDNELTYFDDVDEIAQLFPQLQIINVYNNIGMLEWVNDNEAKFKSNNITVITTANRYPDSFDYDRLFS